MKLIPTVAALAAGLVALSACGALADQPVRPDQPAHVAAWQAYYDATHNLPPRPANHVLAWQAYYDATHP